MYKMIDTFDDREDLGVKRFCDAKDRLTRVPQTEISINLFFYNLVCISSAINSASGLILPSTLANSRAAK